MIRLVYLAALVSLCSACSDEAAPDDVSKTETVTLNVIENVTKNVIDNIDNKATEMENNITLSGKMVYQQHEGGFFGFITDTGERYTLRGLDKSYRQNGMKLIVEGQPLTGMMTTTQFGTVFKVEKVVSADATAVAPHHSEM